MDISYWRKQFEYLTKNKIYLNHASVSPLPKRTVKKINDFLNCRSFEKIDCYEEAIAALNSIKEKLAIILNCDSENIAFCDNVSNSFNILANGFEFKPNDKILLNDIEFPSNVYPFLRLREKGVIIDFIKSKNGIVSSEDIINHIDDSVKLISISAVQFLSGYKADLQKIGNYCKERGIIFSVDAIQALGAVEIDIKKCNINFLSGGGHKWLMGLEGLSYFYVDDFLLEKINQKFVGWTSVSKPWNLLNYDLNLKKGPEKFQNGTMPSICAIALNESLNIFLECGLNQIYEKIKENTLFLREKLRRFDIQFLASEDNLNISGITSIKIPNPFVVLKKLESKNIILSLRENYIRFAPHFYNEQQEIETAIEELINEIKLYEKINS